MVSSTVPSTHLTTATGRSPVFGRAGLPRMCFDPLGNHPAYRAGGAVVEGRDVASYVSTACGRRMRYFYLLCGDWQITIIGRCVDDTGMFIKTVDEFVHASK